MLRSKFPDSQPYPEVVAGTLRDPSRCAYTNSVSPAAARLEQRQPYPRYSAAFSSAATVTVPAAATADNRPEAKSIVSHSGLGHEQTIQHAQVTLVCLCNISSTVSGSHFCVARLSVHLHCVVSHRLV